MRRGEPFLNKVHAAACFGAFAITLMEESCASRNPPI